MTSRCCSYLPWDVRAESRPHPAGRASGVSACPATSPPYSILVLKVTVPGHKQPVYVSIGLAGNGMVARTILYSLRAA